VGTVQDGDALLLDVDEDGQVQVRKQETPALAAMNR